MQRILIILDRIIHVVNWMKTSELVVLAVFLQCTILQDPILASPSHGHPDNKRDRAQEAEDAVKKTKATNIVNKEILAYKKITQKYFSIGNKVSNLQVFNFELGETHEEFIFTYTIDVPVAFTFRVFTQDNGNYGISKDLHKLGLVKVEIYKQTTRTFVSRGEFFVYGFAELDAEKGIPYKIVISSVNAKKIIQMSTPKAFSSYDLNEIYDKHDAMEHAQQLKEVSMELERMMKERKKANALDFMNNVHMQKTLRKYSTYHFIEMGVMIISTFIQLQMIRRALIKPKIF